MKTVTDAHFHDVALAVDVKPEDGRITKVGPYRHRVHWAGENTDSGVTYCNNCGCSFTLAVTLKRGFDPQQRKIYVCAECYAFQGFRDLAAETAETV